VIGAIARCVADAAVVFDAIKGPDPRDRHSLLAASRLPSKPCRVRYVPAFGANPVDKVIAASVARAARVFAELGPSRRGGPAALRSCRARCHLGDRLAGRCGLDRRTACGTARSDRCADPRHGRGGGSHQRDEYSPQSSG